MSLVKLMRSVVKEYMTFICIMMYVRCGDAILSTLIPSLVDVLGFRSVHVHVPVPYSSPPSVHPH